MAHLRDEKVVDGAPETKPSEPSSSRVNRPPSIESVHNPDVKTRRPHMAASKELLALAFPGGIAGYTEV